MTISLALGWWIAPLVVTLLVWAWHFWVNSGPSSGGYAAIADAVVGTMTFFVSLTITLFVWLVWALFR